MWNVIIGFDGPEVQNCGNKYLKKENILKAIKRKKIVLDDMNNNIQPYKYS